MEDEVSEYRWDKISGWIELTADEDDITRGFMIGPDGQKFLLSPKNRVGYQFTYKPSPDERG